MAAAPASTVSSPATPRSLRGVARHLAARAPFARFEPLLYAAFAAACTLGAALLFYRSMRQQIGMLYASLGGDPLLASLADLGPWSAPLDDVFIHFDFARSTARGYPFQWSEGNGYSSGGTSLTYPFVLAAGYALGFVDLHLMAWAALVAIVSVFVLLLVVRRLFAPLPRWTSYLAPPCLLATGVLDWSLWSGMEVAFFLGIWALAVAAWLELVAAVEAPPRRALPWAIATGFAGALAVGTRPEAAASVAIFGVSAAAIAFRRRGVGKAIAVLALVALPGAFVVVSHSLANLALTGDSGAAGAISKFEAYDPYRGRAEILEAWRFFFQYQIERITHYHLADDGRHGLVVWLLALVPLVPRETRRVALLLWVSAAAWVALVAFNGQVRWQNERYTMPAVAWLLLAAALGAATLLSRPAAATSRARWLRAGSAAAVLVALALFGRHQAPRFREQVWFFGRASRNILEQHVRTGLLLRDVLEPRPRRIAVGDAGAIPYVADLPALDLIGLGGYHDLPFARAKRHGLGAVVELLERVPADDRPDVLALYPSWWDALPLWFARPIGEVHVRGNVICAGVAKVIYRPDYAPFAASGTPVGLGARERVVDEVDPGDLVSEQAHDYGLDPPQVGHVEMKLLAHPQDPVRNLWDAGRIVPAGATEHFTVTPPAPGRPFALVFRLAPTRPLELTIGVGDFSGTLEVAASDAWQHARLAVPPVATLRVPVTVRAVAGERVAYHVWVVGWP